MSDAPTLHDQIHALKRRAHGTPSYLANDAEWDRRLRAAFPLPTNPDSPTPEIPHAE